MASDPGLTHANILGRERIASTVLPHCYPLYSRPSRHGIVAHNAPIFTVPCNFPGDGSRVIWKSAGRDVGAYGVHLRRYDN